MVDKRTDITVTPTHKEPYLQGVCFATACLPLPLLSLPWGLCYSNGG